MERQQTEKAAEKDAATRGRATETADTAAGISGAPGLIDHLGGPARGNAPVRAAVLQHMQRSYGNQAVQRRLEDAGAIVQREGGSGAAPSAPVASPPQQQNAPPANPTESYVVPFDRTPKSLPGEEVLFNDVFRHADPSLFQLDYTGVGGKFDSATGAATSIAPSSRRPATAFATSWRRCGRPARTSRRS